MLLFLVHLSPLHPPPFLVFGLSLLQREKPGVATVTCYHGTADFIIAENAQLLDSIERQLRGVYTYRFYLLCYQKEI